MIVLDASAALALLLDPDAAPALAERVARAGQSEAPELLDVEVVHALRRLARSHGHRAAIELM